MRKLHFLSYYYPPVPSVASKRNFRLYRILSSVYDETTIYTTSNSQFFKPLGSTNTPSFIRVLATFDYRTLLLLFKRGEQNKIHVDEVKKQGKPVRFFIRLNDTMPFSFAFGEGGFVFIIAAIWRLMRAIDKDSENVVFTSYRPSANILVGYMVKRFKPGIKWVVSMHDLPYVRKKPNAYFPALQKYIWRKFLQKSDKVITVSEGQAAALREYGIRPLTIRNGVDIRTPVSKDNERFTIAFTGSVYQELMDPGILFKCLQQMIHSGDLEVSRLKIIYAGKDGKYWMHKASQYPDVAGCTENFGIVAESAAMKIQDNANINYLMSWNDSQVYGVLTGKFFEYVGARNPIITLVNGHYDQEFESIFSILHCGMVCYTQDKDYEEKMQHFIRDKYHLWLSGEYDKTYTALDRLTEWTWENRSKQLKVALNDFLVQQ